MILKPIFLIAYATLFTFQSTHSFTVDLIHIDSPQSPTYDPSLSPAQRLANAVHRSSLRFQQLNQQSPASNITNTHGEYLMKYSIGTPPVPSFGVADTGSDIIWTQCLPCIKCFNQTLPLFTPKNSSTYKTIPCNTPRCDKSITITTSCSGTKTGDCHYSGTYGDGSSTNGLLAIETITLQTDVSLPNVTFGCGFENDGLFGGGESGIVGLGGGSLSLVRQLGPLAQGKFSYCLAPWLSGGTSKLSFGADAVVTGDGAVSTPLVAKKPDTLYFLTLEGISVGDKRFDNHDESEGGYSVGNVIIDSGTTLTKLPYNLYERVEKELNRSIALKPIKVPAGIIKLELCYVSEKDEIEHPPVTFHFTGADVELKTENLFIRANNGSLCFAARPAFEEFGVYGNVAQANYLVGYDLDKRTVSFKPAQCLQK